MLGPGRLRARLGPVFGRGLRRRVRCEENTEAKAEGGKKASQFHVVERGAQNQDLPFVEKFHRGRTGENSGLRAARDQFVHGMLALFAVAEGPLVDVHANELIG